MKSPADFPTIREACSPLSGYGAGDARFTNLTSTKGVRTRDSQNARQVNVRTKVGLTSGFVTDSDVQPHVALERSINTRHAKRRMKRGTQRRKSA